ncbi:amino acid synthesis family protein [Streptomyces malaysiensis subsp. malaysiensis]
MAEARLRKVVTVTDELLLELGRPVAVPVRRVAAAAVIANPWAGGGFVADLGPEVERIAPGLARLLTDRISEALGGVDRIESFGKAAIVGLDGEIEHGGALIHTPSSAMSSASWPRAPRSSSSATTGCRPVNR